MDSVQGGTVGIDDVFNALQVAVVDVLSRMAMTEVVFVHQERIPVFRLDQEAGGMVRLTGSQEGMIGIASSVAILREIVSRIVGLPADQLMREDLMDGIAELANMIGGGTKSNAGLTNVKVSTPMAMVGTDLLAEWKTNRRTERFVFQVDDGVLYVVATL
ncbi:MAG: chemotaxis protein CheX [Magnetococcales bacterium]|nr:chemotaxis protein CheX [Magnetococcales bacterium]